MPYTIWTLILNSLFEYTSGTNVRAYGLRFAVTALCYMPSALNTLDLSTFRVHLGTNVWAYGLRFAVTTKNCCEHDHHLICIPMLMITVVVETRNYEPHHDLNP